jgi:tetratricopeptide (TPR) repeat protein
MRCLKIVSLLALFLLVVGCNRDPKVQRQKYLESGNRYFNNGKFKEASIMYRRALQQDLRFGEAYYRLGLSELKLRRPVDAMRAFQRAVELQPDNEDAAAKLSEIFLMAYTTDAKHPPHFLKEIEDNTKKILDKNPKSYDGLRLRGYLYLLRKDLPHAVEDFKLANSLKPNQADLMLVLAQSYIADKRIPEAEALAKQGIEANKEYFPLYNLLAQIYMQTNRPQQAEELLKLKASNNPRNPTPLVELAAFYWTQNRKPEAEAQLTRLTSNVKDFPAAHSLAGDFHFRFREYDKALEQYRQGFQQTADAAQKPIFQKKMVTVLIAQGKMAEANQLVAEVLKENPKDDQAIAIRASLELRAGTREKVLAAINDLQSLVSKNKDNPVLRFEYARALLLKNDLDQARVQLQEAIKLRPDYVLAKLALAQVYVTKGEFPRAVEVANDILQYDANSVPAKLLRSSAMIGLKEYVQARQELNAILQKNPQLTDAQFQLGMINFSEGNFKEAESVFRRLYNSTPQDPRGLLGTVEAMVSQKQYAQALQLINAELEKNPQRLDLRGALAQTAYRSGNYSLAITEYNKLLEKNPKDTLLLMRKAEAQRASGDLQGAIKTVEAAQANEPTSAVPALTLAMLYDATGSHDQSRPFYQKVLQREPDNPMALNNLAYIMAEQGTDLDQALTMVQKAKQKLPNNPEVSDTLGWIYIKKNLSDNAIGIFRDLVTKYPERSTFQYHLAMAYYQKGDKPQAKKLLQGALSKSPSKFEQEKIRDLMAKCG